VNKDKKFATAKHSVDRAILMIAKENIRDEARGIEVALDVLDEHTATLHAQWSGEAEEAYQHAHAEWMESSRAMRGILGQVV